MSVEPPSSGRPTGPPSGPLSGPGQPPGPPSPPPPGGAGPPEPSRPWWRSVPRVALLATAVVAAVALVVVLTRSDGGTGTGSGEVFLQAAGKTGPDPFTESTAIDNSAPPVTPSPVTEPTPENAVRAVDGGQAGLYGGSRKVATCDVEKQISFLTASPEKNRAFASVAGVDPSDVPAYLRSLTPVQLRMDTRVTNHGYRDGAATSYQAVLQAGTAVLVNDRGEPRVRCACGNPLLPPVAQRTTPEPKGDSWPGYRPSNVVVVTPAPQVINVFVVYDPDRGDWFERHRGDTGKKDRKTEPPHRPSPSVSVSTPTKSPSKSPSKSPCPDEGTCPPTATPPSPPSSPKPSPESPTSEEPSPEAPSPQPPSPQPPSPESPPDVETTTQSAPGESISSPAL